MFVCRRDSIHREKSRDSDGSRNPDEQRQHDGPRPRCFLLEGFPSQLQSDSDRKQNACRPNERRESE